MFKYTITLACSYMLLHKGPASSFPTSSVKGEDGRDEALVQSKSANFVLLQTHL